MAANQLTLRQVFLGMIPIGIALAFFRMAYVHWPYGEAVLYGYPGVIVITAVAAWFARVLGHERLEGLLVGVVIAMLLFTLLLPTYVTVVSLFR